MKRICVFCGANIGKKIEYTSAAIQLAEELVSRNIEIVYGGGRIGLMGVLADKAVELGGRVIGVIPESLATKELAHEGVYELRVVNSMHERKAQMAELSDGFISLPGGIGTIEETFEMLTWNQLGFHGKACGLINVEGFYNKLIEFLNFTVDEQFFMEIYRSMLIVEKDPSILLDKFEEYKPPKIKHWLTRDET
jgi:uncharacterized protein (TIGR00730 family)